MKEDTVEIFVEIRSSSVYKGTLDIPASTFDRGQAAINTEALFRIDELESFEDIYFEYEGINCSECMKELKYSTEIHKIDLDYVCTNCFAEMQED